MESLCLSARLHYRRLVVVTQLEQPPFLFWKWVGYGSDPFILWCSGVVVEPSVVSEIVFCRRLGNGRDSLGGRVLETAYSSSTLVLQVVVEKVNGRCGDSPGLLETPVVAETAVVAERGCRG